ncbi:MAG: HAD-IIIC family phosphatase [Bryobacteraceae bacterium]
MSELRQQIEQAIAGGRFPEAKAAIDRMWASGASPATASFLVRCLDKIRGQAPLVPFKIRILRSFTVEPAVPLLRAGALAGGIDLTVDLGEFNAYAQEFLDPSSPLYTGGYRAVVLAVATRDLTPELWDDFADLAPAEVEHSVARAVEQYRNWITLFRSRTAASLIVHGLEMPPVQAMGVYDGQAGAQGQQAAIAAINAGLARVAAETPGVYVLDFDGLIARRGRDHWYDATKWFTVRMPMRAENLAAVAAEWLRFVHPLAGRSAKVVVTDLDNTLWGGVVGEDGLEGIRVHRDEHKGAPYWMLQRALADLRRRGVLLAIASKNNPAEAMEAIENHPGMLLRGSDFSATRISWNPKAQSLREIAAELNVGLDSLVFVDDNPVEREHIRMELPEVAVIELPAEAAGYARAVRDCPLLERLSISAEDRERAAMYAAQAERRRLEEQTTGSVEDFYRSLDQRVTVAIAGAGAGAAMIARVAQLTQKTNQFNLTTKRYGEAEIAAMAADPSCAVLGVTVTDRFGDNGLVGVCLLRLDGAVAAIDTFLMSCRVIGRTVETAILAAAAGHARARGASRIEGWFLPTRKNAPSREFYARHGFTMVEETEAGTRWSLDLAQGAPESPAWIRLEILDEGGPGQAGGQAGGGKETVLA